MNITPFLPINTKEKIDKIIDLIQKNQEPKSIYADILVHIQKVKMQLYFKEKFNSIKGSLPYEKENHPIVKEIIVKNNNNRKDHKIKASKNFNFDIREFSNLSLKDLSAHINIPLSTLKNIIIQKNKAPLNLSPDYILTEEILVPCLEFLQNAYNIKIRKDKERAVFNKEIETAGYYRQKMENKFKPSLGQEGNYRKLIYIPTKT